MENKKKEKTALEVVNDYDKALCGIENLPEIINLLIDRFDLDATEYTDKQALELSLNHKAVYSVLRVIQDSLFVMIERINKIDRFKEV